MFSKGRENEPASAGTLMKQIEHLLAENHDLKIKYYEVMDELKKLRKRLHMNAPDLERAV